MAKSPKIRRKMPSTLCFDRNPAETLDVLSYLRSKLGNPIRGSRTQKKVSKHRNAKLRWTSNYTDFETIESISASAALALAAIYENSLKRSGIIPRITNISRWDADIVDIFSNLGFFEIVGYESNPIETDTNANFVILKMRSGITADSVAISSLINDMKGLYPSRDASEEAMVGLYGAMVEAIGNVVSHAYPGEQSGSRLGRWWMTGAVDRRERRTKAVIYDQGVTIPVSLPRWRRFAGYTQRYFSRFGAAPDPSDPRNDGNAIAAAVEESASSTGESHRGQGLAQMRDFVNHCQEGYLRVMSRCGEVIFRPGKKPEIKVYSTSVGGTLIEWDVLV